MDFSIIDSIPWKDLKSAQGWATSAPTSLRALASENQDDIDDAIYEFLHSEASHQYTTFTATPYVVRSVLFILKHKTFKESQLEEILGFIHACTYSANEFDDLRDEILAGRSSYKEYADDGNESANNLLIFCDKYENIK